MADQRLRSSLPHVESNPEQQHRRIGWRNLQLPAILGDERSHQEGSGGARGGIGQMTITYDDFAKVDIRVGRITRAEPFPEARKPAYKLWVDFGGEIGEKRSSAQITKHYTPEGLIGRQVLAVVNFPPRQIGKVLSEVLVLGLPDEAGEVVLIGPGQEVPLGGKLF